MASGLNEAAIKTLPVPERGNKVHYFPGAVLQGMATPRGFGVRVTAAGVKSFVLNYRHGGREHRITIGKYPDWSALRAVREARELRQRIDRGENPMQDRAPPPPVEMPKTVTDVLDEFVKRHVVTLRTARNVESAINRLAKPMIGQLGIYDVRRKHIAAMLDKIEDEAGPVQAVRTLGHVRAAFNWWASRDDDFTSPITRGMARGRRVEKRDRVLSDDEIRLLWPALSGTFGAIIKLLLLTGQRRSEVSGMAWQEIEPDGVWTIPAERYKTGTAHSVPLSKAAIEIIEAQPRINAFVFPSRRGSPFQSYGVGKVVIDKAAPLAPWRLHDLRRTARTLMARAGVRPDIAERVVGHAQGGIVAVYDRHAYESEKRAALEALAAIIERILAPPSGNVVNLRAR